MILLQLNLSQNAIGAIIATLASTIISVLIWIFTQSRAETKSRIDARANETDDLYEKVAKIDSRVGQLETRMETSERHNVRLDETIRTNHLEITKRLDSIFQMLAKNHNND